MGGLYQNIRQYIKYEDWDDEEYEDSPLTDKEFVRFLKENGVYDKFIYNCENVISSSYFTKTYKSLETFCTDIKKKDYFYDSFDWENSTEGHTFWSKINGKWLNYLDNMNESIDFNDWDEEEFIDFDWKKYVNDTEYKGKKYLIKVHKNDILEFVEVLHKNKVVWATGSPLIDKKNISNLFTLVDGYYYVIIYKNWKRVFIRQRTISFGDDEDWDDEEYEDSPLTDKEFVRFLKENGVYDKFIYNCENVPDLVILKWPTLSNFCSEIRRHNYIDFGFSWSYTPEGHFFWNKINQKWLSYLKFLNENIDFEDWEEEEQQGYSIKEIEELYSIFVNWLCGEMDFDFYDGEDDFRNKFFEILKRTDIEYYQRSTKITNYLDDRWGLYDGFDDVLNFLNNTLEK